VTLHPDFEQLAEKHFIDRNTNIFDRIALLCGLTEYAPPARPRYRIYDGAGQPITCHICGGNHWVCVEANGCVTIAGMRNTSSYRWPSGMKSK
jgi:hypothetical protein